MDNKSNMKILQIFHSKHNYNVLSGLHENFHKSTNHKVYMQKKKKESHFFINNLTTNWSTGQT